MLYLILGLSSWKFEAFHSEELSFLVLPLSQYLPNACRRRTHIYFCQHGKSALMYVGQRHVFAERDPPGQADITLQLKQSEVV